MSEKKANKIVSDPVVKFFASVVGIFVIAFVLMELKHIFIPFVISYFLFFFFEPLNDFLSSKRIPLSVIIVVNLLIVISIIYGISIIVIDSSTSLAAKLPVYERKLNAIISEAAVSLGIKNRAFTHFNISKVLQLTDYTTVASGVFSSTISMFTSIFLSLFFFIFISSGHSKIIEAIRLRFVEKEIKSALKRIKKEYEETHDIHNESETEEYLANVTIQREEKLRKTFKDITQQVQKYVVTKFLISLSVGLVVGVILWLFNIEFYIIWGILSALLNFIPNIGSVISTILPGLTALVQYESFGYALLIVAIIIFFQNVIGNIIEPKIFGNRLGLNPLVILISLLVWGYLWGIIGMFLSVPLTAIIKIVISNSHSKNMQFFTNLMNN
jgi:predicted PurR-regulated permease PerM